MKSEFPCRIIDNWSGGAAPGSFAFAYAAERDIKRAAGRYDYTINLLRVETGAAKIIELMEASADGTAAFRFTDDGKAIEIKTPAGFLHLPLKID